MDESRARAITVARIGITYMDFKTMIIGGKCMLAIVYDEALSNVSKFQYYYLCYTIDELPRSNGR